MLASLLQSNPPMRPQWTAEKAARVIELEAALRALLKIVGAIWTPEGVEEPALRDEALRAKRHHPHPGCQSRTRCPNH